MAASDTDSSIGDDDHRIGENAGLGAIFCAQPWNPIRSPNVCSPNPQAGRTPFAFAACVAIKSMSGGERQSYGSSPISLSLALTAPMFAGLAPDSMIDETNAANSGGDQPCCGDNSVWMKSTPYSGWFLFSMRPYMCTPQPVHA